MRPGGGAATSTPHSEALARAWVSASSMGSSSPVEVTMLGETWSVDIARKTIVLGSAGVTELGDYLKVLLLHYLAGEGGAPVANRFVSFREFEGGSQYYAAFKARAIDPIAREFASRPEELQRAGLSLGAEPMGVGSVGLRLCFFDKLPVAVVLWLGDDEVPTSANMLFDANAGRILPTEDLSVVGGTLSRKLVKLAQG